MFNATHRAPLERQRSFGLGYKHLAALRPIETSKHFETGRIEAVKTYLRINRQHG